MYTMYACIHLYRYTLTYVHINKPYTRKAVTKSFDLDLKILCTHTHTHTQSDTMPIKSQMKMQDLKIHTHTHTYSRIPCLLDLGMKTRDFDLSCLEV